MGRRSKSQSDQLDCTSDCSSESHATLVLSIAHLGNVRLLQHCSTLCANYLRIRDALGRTALHVAASSGHLKLVQWLLERRVEPNQTDWESRWSAVHRSVFYGQLGAASLLARAGGDLRQKDKDGLSPLSLLNQDRRLFKSSLTVGQVHVYTWGSNSNVTLGHDHSRNYPEKLELAHSLVVIRVVLCKFHSVFLTKCGKVLTSGHGLGGRLGHGTEQSLVVPCAVKVGDCVDIAAARNHTVILTKSGGVYSCGQNDDHQLGHGSNLSTAPPPPSCLLPKHVKALKNKTVIGVGAGRYHTALCTASEVYTMGRNLGQLGYEKTYDTQIAPRSVPGVNLDPDDVITHLSASDAATACLTKKCRVFVYTSYSIKTIRWSYLEKSSCLQFSVCASLSDKDHLRKVESEPVKVLMLDSSHDLWYWEPTARGNLLGYVPGLSRLKVVQFSLGRNLSVVTEQGEVFRGSASLSKGPLQLARLPHIQNARAIFTDFKSSNFTFVQEVYLAPQLPRLSPASLSSDLTGFLEEACLPGSVSDLEIEAGGEVFACHRFIVGSASAEALSLLAAARHEALSVKCDNGAMFEALLHYMYGSHILLQPPASHRHAPQPSHVGGGPLASGSSSAFSEGSTASLDNDTTPDTSLNVSLDENDLTDLYDQFATSEVHTDLILTELQPPVSLGGSTPKKKCSLFRGVRSKVTEEEPRKLFQLVDVKADLKALGQLAALFGVSSLQQSVEDLLGSQRVLSKRLVLVSPSPVLKPASLPEYSDLVLVSEEGTSHPTHRCVLVARSEYFHSMLLMGWRESSDTVESLSLPVRESVLRAVLEFIYTDQCPAVDDSRNVEWVVDVLVVADQLLLTRLKDLCERALVSTLSLRNVAEILELAEAYSASQLKSSCLQFISVNAASLLEERLLDSLDVPLLEELSLTYQQMAPFLSKRIIKFAEPDLQHLPESYFVEDPNSEWSKATSDKEFQSSPAASLESVTPKGSGTSGRKKRRRKSSQSDSRKPDPSSPGKTPPPPCPMESAPNIFCNEDTPKSSLREVVAPPSSSSGSVWTEKLSRSAKKASGKARTRLASKFGVRSDGDVSAGGGGVRSDGDVSAGGGGVRSDGDVSAGGGGVRSDGDVSAGGGGVRSDGDVSAGGGGVRSDGDVSAGGGGVRSDGDVSAGGGGVRSDGDVSAGGGGVRSDGDVSAGGGGVCEANSTTNANELIQGSSREGKTGTGAWSQLSSSNGGGSLRAIMAKEEELERSRQQSRHKSPPPVTMTTSSAIPISRGKQESPMQSPTSFSPSVNPWKSEVACSPPVSLKELMMEAETAQRREKLQQRQLKVDDSRVVGHQPVKVPHQQVSFASIVRAQELEQDKSRLRAQKPLRLIQIEERAISELEEIYSARGNPDEYITIVPVVHFSGPLRQTSHDSPWAVRQSV